VLTLLHACISGRKALHEKRRNIVYDIVDVPKFCRMQKAICDHKRFNIVGALFNKWKQFRLAAYEYSV